MSILQEYEAIRKRIGEEKYQQIVKFLDNHTHYVLSDIYYKKAVWDEMENWIKEWRKMFINKEELLEALERKYGDLTDECGCSVSTENGWEWLSIADIVNVINSCDEYDWELVEMEIIF